MNERIEEAFPSLAGTPYTITSPSTPIYNCIAWAARDETRPWWPDPMDLGYWPSGVPREETLQAFVSAFASLGYQTCSDSTFEPGFEKLAIYASPSGQPTHMARQLGDGTWTSKLGDWEDIAHAALQHLAGQTYGDPVLYLRRPANSL